MSFFFSSRRRHTRSTRDWSSDVCSSDLSGDSRNCKAYSGSSQRRSGNPYVQPSARLESSNAGSSNELCSRNHRSEERRVGKECKSTSTQYHKKKQKFQLYQDTVATQ